ncbi:collagen alpha-1(I) chain-like [Lepus europaeus]|uniref:collagen alpha-1(I) chain-like n=1 Tax=Lepus europaeus TaxID=9983 RepID=UPI002B45F38C|nr:collagen alpha-1(I) chain-like [Lepus europaeus]
MNKGNKDTSARNEPDPTTSSYHQEQTRYKKQQRNNALQVTGALPSTRGKPCLLAQHGTRGTRPTDPSCTDPPRGPGVKPGALGGPSPPGPAGPARVRTFLEAPSGQPAAARAASRRPPHERHTAHRTGASKPGRGRRQRPALSPPGPHTRPARRPRPRPRGDHGAAKPRAAGPTRQNKEARGRQRRAGREAGGGGGRDQARARRQRGARPGAPHTHHWELRNGGGGGGEPGGAGPRQPLTAAGIFRTGSEDRGGRGVRGGRGATTGRGGPGACARAQPIRARRRTPTQARWDAGGAHGQGRPPPPPPTPNKTRAGARAGGPRRRRPREGQGARSQRGSGAERPGQADKRRHLPGRGRPAPSSRGVAAAAPRASGLRHSPSGPREPAPAPRPPAPSCVTSALPPGWRPRPARPPGAAPAAARRLRAAVLQARPPSSAAPPPCPRPRARARPAPPPARAAGARGTWLPGRARGGARGRSLPAPSPARGPGPARAHGGRTPRVEGLHGPQRRPAGLGWPRGCALRAAGTRGCVVAGGPGGGGRAPGEQRGSPTCRRRAPRRSPGSGSAPPPKAPPRVSLGT